MNYSKILQNINDKTLSDADVYNCGANTADTAEEVQAILKTIHILRKNFNDKLIQEIQELTQYK